MALKIICAVFLCFAVARGDETAHPMFPQWVGELKIGTPLAAFVKLRPTATAGSLVFEETKPADLTRADQSLQELLEVPADFQSGVQANYGFRAGKLQSVSLVRMLRYEDAKTRRIAFFRWCEKNWGKNSKKKVVSMGDGKLRYMAPMLVWDQDGVRVKAAWTPDFSEVAPVSGFFRVRIYNPDFEREFGQGFEEQDVAEDVRDRLFRSMSLEKASPQR